MNPENTDLTKIKCEACHLRFWLAREVDAKVCPKCETPVDPETRTDAKHPPDEATERAEIEAEKRLDDRRERHFDRNGHF